MCERVWCLFNVQIRVIKINTTYGNFTFNFGLVLNIEPGAHIQKHINTANKVRNKNKKNKKIRKTLSIGAILPYLTNSVDDLNVCNEQKLHVCHVCLRSNLYALAIALFTVLFSAQPIFLFLLCDFAYMLHTDTQHHQTPPKLPVAAAPPKKKKYLSFIPQICTTPVQVSPKNFTRLSVVFN